MAFNQDRLTRWLRERGLPSAIWVLTVIILVVLLAVIWTRDLAAGFKIGTTIALAFMAVFGALLHAVYYTISIAKRSDGSETSTGSDVYIKAPY